MSLPLAIRLPAPPAVFVGRKPEVAWLRAAVRYGSVAVVAGLGGLGKTALVLSTIYRHFPKHAPRTVFVTIRPGVTVEGLPLDLTRTLVLAAQLNPPNWAKIGSDRDGLIEMAIDLAEPNAFWVVLDDFQHVGTEAGEAVLVTISRYARRSRWIVTTRVAPEAPDLSARTVTLGALDAVSLGALAKKLRPGLPADEHARLIAHSAGSPWRLHHALAPHRPGKLDAKGTLLATLPDNARDLVTTLLLIEKPVPAETLGAATRVPPSDVVRDLAARGVVELAGGGLRLHDVARSVLAEETPPATLRDRASTIGAALSQSPDPDVAV